MKEFNEIKPQPQLTLLTIEDIKKDPIASTVSSYDISFHMPEGYRYGVFKYVKNGYGFVDGVFCHIKDNPGLASYDAKHVLVKVAKTEKGYKGVIEPDRDKTREAYRDAFVAALNERVESRNDIRRIDYEYDLKQWQKEANAYAATGIYAETVEKHHKNNYGTKDWEYYHFNRIITLEEFRDYLTRMGINLTPETVDAPVTQGCIELWSGRNDCVHGTEPSEYWCRWESKVYYD